MKFDSNGLSQLDSNGNWDNAGLLFGLVGKKEGFLSFKFGIKSPKASFVRTSLGLYKITHDLGTDQYVVSAMFEADNNGQRTHVRVKNRTATTFEIFCSGATTDTGQDVNLHILVFGRPKKEA